MQFVRTHEDRLIFRLSQREKRLLFKFLRLYPLLPVTYHRLSRTADPIETESDQQLLEEALAGRKEENRGQLLALLNEPDRFRRKPGGYEFWLAPGQVEWLLQILNDLRVGCWLKLDCPDEQNGRPPVLTDQNAWYYVA